MPRLLIDPQLSPQYAQILRAAALPDLEIVTVPDPTVDLLLASPPAIRALLPQLPALKWAQCTWAGVEPLLDPALRRDYQLTNARGVFGPLMSEYVFAYLLMRERRILERLQNQQQSRWDATLTSSLRGKTLGLLGVGSIGSHLAATARHFGMNVHGYTRSSETSPHVGRYFHGEDLLSFAGTLDVLVSVLPNTPATRAIVDAPLLAALPRGAVLINAGRGSAIAEPAQLAALESGHLAMAVLDVFEQEPLPPAHPFWRAPNLFITSHTAAPSFPADIAALFIDNYRRYHAGQPLQYLVDFERGY